MTIAEILQLAKSMAKHLNREVSTISTRAAKGGHVFGRLEAGERSATERKLKEYGRWFAENWPDDLPWPEGIDRPKVEKKNYKGAA